MNKENTFKYLYILTGLFGILRMCNTDIIFTPLILDIILDINKDINIYSIKLKVNIA